MRSIVRVLTVSLLLTCYAAAQAAAPQKKPMGPVTMDRVLNSQLSNVEHEFVDAADAMPEDKYSFAPTEGEFKGVRTFGEQVRHVAATNYLIGAVMLGDAKPPADTGEGESGPETIKSKADIMQYLKASFEYMHKATASVTNEQKFTEMVKSPFGQGQMPRGSLAVLTVGHCFDHYGQMVEYLRMNGIIPPASRPRK